VAYLSVTPNVELTGAA